MAQPAANVSPDYYNLIPQLRQTFQDQFKENDLVYKEDLERLQQNDKYAHQFLLHQVGNVDEAVKMVIACFKWRKEFGIREITEQSLPREVLERGSIYWHNLDKEKKRILWFRVEVHKKGEEASKRGLAYFLEKANQEAPDEAVTVIMDLSNCGISHNDMDFTRFLIDCFKHYFPKFLVHLLVYEMPWILNAAWKVIRLWLDEAARNKIKFENKDTIGNYIDKDQLPPHMDGTDTWKYSYTGPT